MFLAMAACTVLLNNKMSSSLLCKHHGHPTPTYPTCLNPPQSCVVEVLVWRVVLLVARMSFCFLRGLLEPIG